MKALVPQRSGGILKAMVKFVENIVQAISRSLLCHSMRNLDEAGLNIVMHVHDEVVFRGSFRNMRTRRLCPYGSGTFLGTWASTSCGWI